MKQNVFCSRLRYCVQLTSDSRHIFPVWVLSTRCTGSSNTFQQQWARLPSVLPNDGTNPACALPLSPDARERSAKRFSVDGVFNYTSLLLSQEDDMLYVGAREALFALSLTDISKAKLQKNVRVVVDEQRGGQRWEISLVTLSKWRTRAVFRPNRTLQHLCNCVPVSQTSEGICLSWKLLQGWRGSGDSHRF